MNKTIIVVVALAAIGMGMIIAGISNLRSADEQEKNPSKKRVDNSEGNPMAGWLFGSSSGMDPRRAGRARINIGVIMIAIAFVIAAAYIF